MKRSVFHGKLQYLQWDKGTFSLSEALYDILKLAMKFDNFVQNNQHEQAIHGNLMDFTTKVRSNSQWMAFHFL